ncbi:xylose isomerase [Bosea sp. Leaf344]|uniref:sugar phosphate isomerase/epimerase family protein n=1 Tax=Bosea sp. Leaf344 TaxID=1736346 RepID=UPI0006F307B1|nr:sugar phosphate isomerase/epimerase family protein [Bosea sp. Leaf344]KQU50182.1 xylose isomerase [Bosea sp. Leaf344]
MIINTFSYLWSATAIDAIVELSGHGYSVFEVPVSAPHCWPDEMSPSDRAAAKRRLQNCGASVMSLNAGGYDINLASPAANMRRKSTDHIEAVIDLAFDWGAADVVISPGTRRPMISPSLQKTFGWLYESLDILLPRAEQAGVRLLLENTPYCFRPTFEEMLVVVDHYDSERLKIVYDVANAAYIKEDPVACLLSGAPAIGLVHVSDTGLDEWGHDPIGTGVIDFEALGQAVEATCTIENVVLEIIRQNEPLESINTAISELQKRGWNLNGPGR